MWDKSQMAGNDWLNSYLEAILDVGPGLDDSKSSLLLRERGRFSPTRYFVEEVIGFDETDLYRSWVRVCSLALFLIPLIHFFLLIFFFSFYRLHPPGVLRRGTPGWRICAGGFGTSLARRSRFDYRLSILNY